MAEAVGRGWRDQGRERERRRLITGLLIFQTGKRSQQKHTNTPEN